MTTKRQSKDHWNYSKEYLLNYIQYSSIKKLLKDPAVKDWKTFTHNILEKMELGDSLSKEQLGLHFGALEVKLMGRSHPSEYYTVKLRGRINE